MKDKKNIAVLTTGFYPIKYAASACIDKDMQVLKKDYNFHVITKTENIDFETFKDYPIQYIATKLHKLKLKLKDNIARKKFVFLSKFGLKCIDAFRLIQTQFVFPSWQKWEVTQYYNELNRLNKSKPIDTVIAVSNNFVTQLAMLKFKKARPDVNWVAFILDPYAEYYVYYKYKLFKRFWKRLNLKKEKEIYEKCDYVLFSSEMYRYAPKKFKINQDKVFKIEFVLDNLKPEVENLCSPGHSLGVCKMIFAGCFYKEIRNPEFLLRTISNVENVELDLFVDVGECEDIINKYQSPNINRYKYVKYDEYLKYIYFDYDILINIGNNASLQAPSKMLELLSTGKPIINFYYQKDDQYHMIEKYPLGINIGRNDKNVHEEIAVFCKRMKGKQISYQEVETLFPNNILTSQVELLKHLIEREK